MLCGSVALGALATTLPAQPPSPVTRPPTAARTVQLPVKDSSARSVERRRVRPGGAPLVERHAAPRTSRGKDSVKRASRSTPVRPSTAGQAARDSARRAPCAATWPGGTTLLLPIALVTSEVRIPVAKRGAPPLTPCRVPVRAAATPPALPLILAPPTMIGARPDRGGMWWWLLGAAALGGGLLGSGVTSDDGASLPDALAEVPVSLPPATPPRTVPTAPASPEGSGTSSGSVGAPAPSAPTPSAPTPSAPAPSVPVDAPVATTPDGTLATPVAPDGTSPLDAPAESELPPGAIPGVTMPGTTTPSGTPMEPTVTPNDLPGVPTVPTATPPTTTPDVVVPSATTAPEPGTGVLLGSALLLGGVWLRRRRSAHGIG